MIQLLDAKTLAAKLHVSTRFVWALRYSDRIPRCVKIGRVIRWRLSDIERWVSLDCPSRERFEALTAVEAGA